MQRLIHERKKTIAFCKKRVLFYQDLFKCSQIRYRNGHNRSTKVQIAFSRTTFVRFSPIRLFSVSKLNKKKNDLQRIKSSVGRWLITIFWTLVILYWKVYRATRDYTENKDIFFQFFLLFFVMPGILETILVLLKIPEQINYQNQCWQNFNTLIVRKQVNQEKNQTEFSRKSFKKNIFVDLKFWKTFI